jgi:hypothetical protein
MTLFHEVTGMPLTVAIVCHNSALVRLHKQSESRLAALACRKADTAEVLTSDRRGSNTPLGPA